MTDVLSDVRYALRLLRKSPTFAVGTAMVLALGIGSNVAVFSALDQLVLRPLPYADPNRLGMLWEDFSAFGTARNRVSPATFLVWQPRTVAESRHEIAVRMAIGATPGRIVRAVVGRAIGLSVVGVAVGLSVSVGTTRLLGSLLFGVSPVDPAVLASVALFIAAISIAASYVPARRAGRADPLTVLRGE